jgi:TetR/AcrR family transcriptional regulator, transcriptional repressor for nem operon
MIQRDTKALILETARALILAKGYTAVGLNEILTAAGVPKGSFYHYFKSKEDFGAELMRDFLQGQEAFLRQHLTNPDINPYRRIISLFEMFRSGHEKKGCGQLCLIAKLGAEVSDLSEAIRRIQSEGIRDWLELYAACIREGQETGVIDPHLDASATAAFIHDLWQGASLRMQIDQDLAPLENAIEMIKRSLSPG